MWRLLLLMGRERKEYADQDPVNVEAAELIAALHDLLIDSGYSGTDLERFLVRIVFCLFAEDTGIFQRNQFLDYVELRTEESGGNVGPMLLRLFEVLDTDYPERSKILDENLSAFPYVNGSLFEGKASSTPTFDAHMREALLDAARFDWTQISPAIFGAMFQAAMDPIERDIKGAHYTSEANIRKAIRPLFLEGLERRFSDAAKLKTRATRKERLSDLRSEIASLKVFDPACGCGNFLVVAYRELRRPELEIIKELHKDKKEADRMGELFQELVTNVRMDNFFGLEINEFACEVARTAMWMMDHLMNRELGEVLTKPYPTIPLRNTAVIRHADALETDWNDVVPAKDCNFVIGNPPFKGSKRQTTAQRKQVARIAKQSDAGGSLDFVCAWYLKAATFANQTDL